MDLVELKVKQREGTSKKGAKATRARGDIPAIFYGQGIEAQPLAAPAREFRKAISTEAGTNVILSLDIEGAGKETAIVKDVQRNPLRDDFLHVDFMKILMTEAIEAAVPLTVAGESPGVKDGGVLQHSLWEVLVKALPMNLPASLEISIGELAIGDSLRVSDISAPADVEILTAGDEMVVSVVPPTELKEEELVVEEEELEPELVGEKAEEGEEPEAVDEEKAPKPAEQKGDEPKQED